MKFHHLILLLTFAIQPVCTSPESDISVRGTIAPNRYATGFSLEITDQGVKKIHTASASFYLFPENLVIPDSLPKNRVIRTPVKRIVCTSTSHIPLLDYLNVESSLVGFPTPDYISSPDVREQINAGRVTDVGIDQSVNMERILTLEPDVVMGYSLGQGNNLDKISSVGIPVLLNNEFLEKHPLGRAEWIRVAGWLFGKEALADSLFHTIEQRYTDLIKLTSDLDNRPSVFSGVMYGDTWFLPGGKNNMSRLFLDAGLNYLWSEDESNGFLELSFESVLEKAGDADLWIGVANFNSLDELRSSDERYGLFEAFRHGNIYTYDARRGPTGGSEYLELGYLRPDLILSDLISIGHPGLTGSDTSFFRAKLQE